MFLDDSDLHPRARQRIELTRRLIEPRAASVFVVPTRGESATARVLSLVLLGDLVSLYLAVLRGIDPTPAEPIDRLKEQLDQLALAAVRRRGSRSLPLGEVWASSRSAHDDVCALAAPAPDAAVRGGGPGAAGGPLAVVVSSRDVRMNLAGVVACAWAATARGRRLHRAPGGAAEPNRSWPVARGPGTRGYRIYGPFLLGRQGFSVPSTRGKVVRLQFFPRAGYLVRLAGTIPVRSPPATRSRGRTGLRTEQEINVYVSPLQTYR